MQKNTKCFRCFSLSLIVSLLAFEVFLLAPSPISAEEGRWEQAAPLPLAVQEIYATTHNGLVYSGGGILAQGGEINDRFWSYSPQLDQWIERAPLPAPRHHVTFATAKGQIFAIGGFVGTLPHWRAQSSVFIYDPHRGRWSVGPELPAARGEHITAVVKDKIYVIGGRVRARIDAAHFKDHNDTSRHDLFDPVMGVWSSRAPALIARNSAAAAVIEDKIYVVGGRQYTKTKDGRRQLINVPDLEVYDPLSDSWQKLAPMPVAQGGLAAASLGGKLYVFGGEQWTSEVKVLATCWVYDPATDSWAAIEGLSPPRHGLAAAVVGKEIFVIGGATRVGLGAVAINQRWRPAQPK